MFTDDTAIELIGLPTRVCNVLRYNVGVSTVGDLRRKALTPTMLGKLHNIGQESVALSTPVMVAAGVPGWEGHISSTEAPSMEATIAGRRWRCSASDPSTVATRGLLLTRSDLEALLRLMRTVESLPDPASTP